MVKLACVATCSLNQWSLDFDLNLSNILSSIREAKRRGARFRTGPELEVSGYGCEDHFLEQDTFRHSWESIATLLQTDATDDCLCDVGMPVMHRGVRYNCRAYMLNRKLLLIRPKLFLANDGNYREPRWFTAWSEHYTTSNAGLQEHPLPHSIRAITGQYSCPIGNAVLQCDDTSIASETCEELFTPQAPHIDLTLNGVEIIANGSGSHHSLRKLDIRLALMRNATSKAGGAYLYANQQGCDGGRLYYDGCASCFINGEMVAQGSQFSVKDVEVVTAVMDLDEIRSYRGAISSRSVQAAAARPLPRVVVPFKICAGVDHSGYDPTLVASIPMAPRIHLPEEEIAFGPACWLWDYLRRSGASGYFLPLSGGADSASTAAMVGIMCHLVVEAIAKGDQTVLADARRMVGESDGYVPRDPREFCQRIMHTCYMGTSNSSQETNERAANIAKEIGSYHLTVNIDRMVSAILAVFTTLVGKTPKYKVHGGSNTENLALQNIQARLRMVFSYLLAQLLPWVRSQKGFLLVLGSANVDEALRGYMTKYDCSSADINPIGGIAKGDLKRFLVWTSEHFPFPSLANVVRAKPTAELEPITAEYTQSDEADMGMTYEELGIFGRLRKLYRCGPVSMYQKLVSLWTQSPPASASEPVHDTGDATAKQLHVGSTSSEHLNLISRPVGAGGVSTGVAAAVSSSTPSNPNPTHPPLLPLNVANKVQHFFYYYSVNRHKLTTLTPSYHAENYSPEDNRFDLRPFLYNNKWARQFNIMNQIAQQDQQTVLRQRERGAQQPGGQDGKDSGPAAVVRQFEGGEGDGLMIPPGKAAAQL